jgi:uncharacterized protein
VSTGPISPSTPPKAGDLVEIPVLGDGAGHRWMPGELTEVTNTHVLGFATLPGGAAVTFTYTIGSYRHLWRYR